MRRRYRQAAEAGTADPSDGERTVIPTLPAQMANLFLHYAFDAWMRREMPDVPFAAAITCSQSLDLRTPGRVGMFVGKGCGPATPSRAG